MEDLAEFVVNYASKLGVTYVDVRIEEHYDETIEVMNGVPEKHIAIRKRGAGIRVLTDGAWGFQSITNLSREGLQVKLCFGTITLCGEPCYPTG
ncbi:MAG: PmbA/TldA family metallopeptidase [Candidatus Baldrarchaeia archaeon]